MTVGALANLAQFEDWEDAECLTGAGLPLADGGPSERMSARQAFRPRVRFQPERIDRGGKEAERAQQAANAIRSEEDAKQSELLYDASHGALEDVLEHINTNAKLRGAPGVRELQALLRARYEQLVGLLEHGTRQHDRMPLALAYDRLGKLYDRDDKTETALEKYEQSSRIYAAMAPEATTPERTAEVRRRLGLSLTEQGNLLFDLGRLQESASAYRKALQESTIALQALDSQPADAAQNAARDAVLKSIAEDSHGLGILLQSESKRKESLAEFKRALTIRMGLVARNSERKEFQRDLARSYGYQGDVELELGLLAQRPPLPQLQRPTGVSQASRCRKCGKGSR